MDRKLAHAGLRPRASSTKTRIETQLVASLAMIDTPEWRIFLMKDLAAMEEAQKHEAKIVESDRKF